MNTNEQLDKIRHSLAHLLAMAVLKKDPQAKLTIGPVIDNGFYYDFDLSPDTTINEKILGELEKDIKKLIKQKIDFKKKEIDIEEAREIFKDNKYKLELIEEIAEKGEKISIYQSSDLTDLCAGPHIENTSEIDPDSFKLTKIAGAYWRGSEKNKMLTRIYGLSFDTKERLEEYLKQQEEAEKRDHRLLGEKQELFMISEEVGKGLPLWLPNGAFIRKQLEDYMYKKEFDDGYKYVYTPILTHKKLYETSGHLAHYREDMYNPIDIEGEEYFLKPMNCPHHHMIYRHKPLSYRDLPLRLAEFGLVHRFERSGVLTGLIRARCFTQNDSHIYCREDQLKDELIGVLKMFKEVYSDFGIKDFWFRLSLPDFENNPEKFGDVKNKDVWNKAADLIREAMNGLGLKYIEAMGEAAFYGPKIDVQIRNVSGKEDTIATAQVDFYSANKFDLTFNNTRSEKEKVVIIHRAIMGSFDRFFAFLVEQYAGNFPLWLSPVQVKILPISETHKNYAKEVFDKLKEDNIRVELDETNETLGKKIRNGKMEKTPYMLVIGDKEVESKTVTAESRDEGNLGQFTIKKLLDRLQREVEEKSYSPR